MRSAWWKSAPLSLGTVSRSDQPKPSHFMITYTVQHWSTDAQPFAGPLPDLAHGETVFGCLSREEKALNVWISFDFDPTPSNHSRPESIVERSALQE